MHDFFSVLIMPLSILWVLIIVAVTFLLFKKLRTTILFFLISFLWLLIISTGFIPSVLVDSLENQYPPLNIRDNMVDSTPVYIMVLGANFSGDQKLSPNNKLSSIALGRLVEGIRLHRLIQGSKIVFSDNIPKLIGNQADIMTQAAIALGVKSACIEKITMVKHTKDEAKKFYSTFGSKGSLILVTDAIHMPRAMKLFKKAGLHPVASPTNYLNTLDSPETFWIPSASNISKMEKVFHEYVGMACNWAVGY